MGPFLGDAVVRPGRRRADGGAHGRRIASEGLPGGDELLGQDWCFAATQSGKADCGVIRWVDTAHEIAVKVA